METCDNEFKYIKIGKNTKLKNIYYNIIKV